MVVVVMSWLPLPAPRGTARNVLTMTAATPSPDPATNAYLLLPAAHCRSLLLSSLLLVLPLPPSRSHRPQAHAGDVRIQASVSRMQAVIEAGRTIRERHNRPLKQPLSKVTVVHSDREFLEDITGELFLGSGRREGFFLLFLFCCLCTCVCVCGGGYGESGDEGVHGCGFVSMRAGVVAAFPAAGLRVCVC